MHVHTHTHILMCTHPHSLTHPDIYVKAHAHIYLQVPPKIRSETHANKLTS